MKIPHIELILYFSPSDAKAKTFANFAVPLALDCVLGGCHPMLLWHTGIGCVLRVAMIVQGQIHRGALGLKPPPSKLMIFIAP